VISIVEENENVLEYIHINLDRFVKHDITHSFRVELLMTSQEVAIKRNLNFVQFPMMF